MAVHTADDEYNENSDMDVDEPAIPSGADDAPDNSPDAVSRSADGGNWYRPRRPGSASGDRECAENPQRKVYGVPPCFGRVFRFEPQNIDDNIDDVRPQFDGPVEREFTTILVRWAALDHPRYLGLLVDLEQTTDLFLRWYIFWATNIKADDQILKLYTPGEETWRYVTNRGNILSMIGDRDNYSFLELREPYPLECNTFVVKFYMGPGPEWYDQEIEMVNYQTSQVRDLRQLCSEILTEETEGADGDPGTFYFTMSPDPNSDIPKEHQYLEEVVDEVGHGALYVYDRVSEEAMREDPTIEQPCRFPGWGFDDPIHVRTPVTLIIPKLCNYVFKLNLQMAVKTVLELREFVVEKFPKTPNSNALRFSRYRNPSNLSEPLMNVPGHTLSRAAYTTHTFDAITLSEPITIYAHWERTAQMIERNSFYLRFTDLEVTYHASLAENDTKSFVIRDCPIRHFLDDDWEEAEEENPKWMPPLRKFRELLNFKLFDQLGITPDVPRLTQFSKEADFPENMEPVTPTMIKDWHEHRSAKVHMWNSSPDMLSMLKTYMNYMKYNINLRDGFQMPINTRYAVDDGYRVGFVPPMSPAQIRERDIRREMLNQPLVYYDTNGTDLRGGEYEKSLLDLIEKDSPAAEKGDLDVDGFDLQNAIFESWLSTRPGHGNRPSIAPETTLPDIDKQNSPTQEEDDQDVAVFDISEEAFEADLAAKRAPQLPASSGPAPSPRFSTPELAEDDPTDPGSAIVVQWTVLGQLCKHIIHRNHMPVGFTIGELKKWMYIASKVPPQEQIFSFPNGRQITGIDHLVIDITDGNDWLRITMTWNENSIAKENIPVVIHRGERPLEYTMHDIPTSITRVIWFMAHSTIRDRSYVSVYGNSPEILESEIRVIMEKGEIYGIPEEGKLQFIRSRPDGLPITTSDLETEVPAIHFWPKKPIDIKGKAKRRAESDFDDNPKEKKIVRGPWAEQAKSWYPDEANWSKGKTPLDKELYVRDESGKIKEVFEPEDTEMPDLSQEIEVKQVEPPAKKKLGKPTSTSTPSVGAGKTIETQTKSPFANTEATEAQLASKEARLQRLETVPLPAAVVVREEIKECITKLRDLLIQRWDRNDAEEKRLIILELEICSIRSDISVPLLTLAPPEVEKNTAEMRNIMARRPTKDYMSGGAEITRLRDRMEGLQRKLDGILEAPRQEYQRLAEEAVALRSLIANSGNRQRQG